MKAASFTIHSMLFGVALAIATFAQPVGAVPESFAKDAAELLADSYDSDGPGVAVIVTEGGRTVFAAGRGLSNIAAGTPITPCTVFRLGSITKQFTAAVVLQLAEEGKLSLSDPLSKYLPDFPAPGSEATIRQLLNHTSGVQSYTDIPGWMVEANTSRAYTTTQMVSQFSDLQVVSLPGEAWMYNNSGYVLLAAVIEKVTNAPWYDAVRNRIVEPLGLATLRYGVVENEMPHMASGYTVGDDGEPTLAQMIHMSVPSAAGSLIGDVTDLATWANALHHGRVIGASSYSQMIAPTVMNGGENLPYGFGLYQSDAHGHRLIGHGGGIFGFSTSSYYMPEDDIFVAVFANSDRPATNPNLVALRLAAMAANDPYPTFKAVVANLDDLQPWFGIYTQEDGTTRAFATRDGRLFMSRGNGGEIEVFAAGNRRFFYGSDSLSWFELVQDNTGNRGIEMHPNGSHSGVLASLSKL